jgi:redox-sensitive bicupin YhaK (pirin superfamily)
MAYFVEGNSLQVDESNFTSRCALTLRAEFDTVLANPSSSTQTTEVLVLQGRPIGEPVAHSGPFVMNTQEELRQAYSDYQRIQFGGWPWQEDAVVFPREKGRFALMKSEESYPPSGGAPEL